MAGAFIGEPLAGGSDIEGFITPNLPPHPSGRIFKLIPGSPMPWNSFGRMSDEELTTLYNYLKTIKPVRDTIH
jgi:hypothetical protein